MEAARDCHREAPLFRDVSNRISANELIQQHQHRSGDGSAHSCSASDPVRPARRQTAFCTLVFRPWPTCPRQDRLYRRRRPSSAASSHRFRLGNLGGGRSGRDADRLRALVEAARPRSSRTAGTLGPNFQSEPAASIRSTAPVGRKFSFEPRLYFMAAPAPQGLRHIAVQRDPYFVIRAFAKRDIHVPAPTKHHHFRHGNDNSELNQLLDFKSPSIPGAPSI